MLIKVQHEDFDSGLVTDYFRQYAGQVGAIVSFTGLVREFQHQADDPEQVQALTLEHYPGMTEASLQKIAQEAQTKWDLNDVVIIHRVGTLYPADNIVLVATASAHRQHAFESCQYIMDILKTSAPFWKKEETNQGSRWVEAKSSDQDAASQWASKDQMAR